jgi:hypothetical protein
LTRYLIAVALATVLFAVASRFLAVRAADRLLAHYGAPASITRTAQPVLFGGGRVLPVSWLVTYHQPVALDSAGVFCEEVQFNVTIGGRVVWVFGNPAPFWAACVAGKPRP